MITATTITLRYLFSLEVQVVLRGWLDNKGNTDMVDWICFGLYYPYKIIWQIQVQIQIQMYLFRHKCLYKYKFYSQGHYH